jgi:phage gp37-like protein
VSPIAAIEDEILARLRAAFRGRLREIDHKPAKLDAGELARVLSQAPGAYIAFLGWRPAERLPEGVVVASWGVYLLAANAAGDQARRRGAPGAIGAYEMVCVAAGALDDWEPASAAGKIGITACENLAAEAFEKAGRSCYGLAIEMPVEIAREYGVAAPAGGPGSADELVDPLANFLIFDAAWDVPPAGNVPPPPNPAAVPAVPAPNRDAHDRMHLPPPPSTP